MELRSLLRAAVKVKDPRNRAMRAPAGACMHASDELVRAAETRISYFGAVRLRAAVLLLWGAALRASEVVALKLGQLVVDPLAQEWEIRETFLLRSQQAVRRKGGKLPVSPEAKIALKAYLTLARSKGWVSSNPRAQVFAGSKGQRGTRRQGGLSKRTLQHAWITFQRECRVDEVRALQDLRHDAILDRTDTLAGKAVFGRISRRAADKYMVTDPDGVVTNIADRHRAFEAHHGCRFVFALVPIASVSVVACAQAIGRNPRRRRRR